MKKNVYYIMIALLTSLTLGACGGDDNKEPEQPYTVETVDEAPAWQIDWSGSTGRPAWQDPAVQSFENFAVLLVKLEETLHPYASDDDLMALFVDGELRGLSAPARGADGSGLGATSFLLKAYGNEANGEYVDVTLKYYNSRLGQIFSRSATMPFTLDEVYGIGEDFIPQFTLGAEKYPVVTQLTLTPTDLSLTALAESGVTIGDGDLLAAFVGNECRGVMALGSQSGDGYSGQSSGNAGYQSSTAPYQLTVFGRTEGERYTLKYYHAASHRVFTLKKSF